VGARGQTTKYPIVVPVRMSEADQLNLETIAALSGESLSAAVRRLIKEEISGSSR
jgi:hypothetical protein